MGTDDESLPRVDEVSNDGSRDDLASLADLSKEWRKSRKRSEAEKFTASRQNYAGHASKMVNQFWRNIAVNLKEQEEQSAQQAAKRARQQRLQDMVSQIEATAEVLTRRLCSRSSSSSQEIPEFDSKNLSAHVTTPLPYELLTQTLRSYQHIGLHWLASLYDTGLNGILADEMGLGKTIMTIALIAHLALEKGIWGPHLIIVPTSVQLNWVFEFNRWTPGFKVLSYHGKASERTAKRHGGWGDDVHNVVVASYAVAMADEFVFKRKQWHYMVLDEAQNIKNFRSKTWQTLVDFKSVRRLMLTGTPLQNDLMELWALMHFLMPNAFGTSKDFKAWFADPMNKAVCKNQVDPELVKRLHNVLRPFMLRRLKSEVEIEMPAKHEYVVHCRMSGQQKKLYNEFLDRRDVQRTLQSSDYLRVLNICMQLRKVCNHPELFIPRAAETPYTMEPIEMVIPGRIFMALHETVGKRSAGSRPGDFSFSSHLLRRLPRPRGSLESLSSCTSTATMGSIADALVCKFQQLRYLRPAALPRSLPAGASADGAKRYWIAGHWITSKEPHQREKRTVQLPVGQRVCRLLTRGFSPGEKAKGTASWRGCGALLGAPGRGLTKAEVALLNAGVDPVMCRSRKRILKDTGKSADVVHHAASTPVLLEAGTLGTVVEDSSQLPEGSVMVCWDTPLGGRAFRQVVSVNAIRPVSISERRKEEISEQPPKRQRRRRDLDCSAAVSGETDLKTSIARMFQSVFPEGSAASQLAVQNEVDASLGTICWDMAEGVSLIGHESLSLLAYARDASSAFSAKISAGLHQEALLLASLQRLEAKIRRLGCLQPFIFRVPRVQVMRSLPHSLVREAGKLAHAIPVEELPAARAELCPTGAAGSWLLRWLHSERTLRRQQLLLEMAMSSNLQGRPAAESMSRYINRWSYPLTAPLSCRLPEKRFLEHDCGKLQELTGMLKRFKAEGSKCIIFTQFALMLNILEEYASFHYFRYVRLDGSVKVEMRQSLVDRFNADEDMFLFIASTRAGGVGINLTAANVVIFYDSDWNPAIDRQATDRAHRIGQTRDVHIYRMITEKSVEQNIWQRQLQKRKLDDLVIDQGSFTPDSMVAIAKKQQAWSLDTVRSLVTGRDEAASSAGHSPTAAASDSESRASEAGNLQAVLRNVEDDEDASAAAELFQLDAAEAAQDMAEQDLSLMDGDSPSTTAWTTASTESAALQRDEQCPGESREAQEAMEEDGVVSLQLGRGDRVLSMAANRMARRLVKYPKGKVAARKVTAEEKRWTPAQLVTNSSPRYS